MIANVPCYVLLSLNMVLLGYGLEFRVKVSVLVLFILLNMKFATANSNNNQNHKEVAFYRIRSTSLVGNITLIKSVKREMECALKCLRNYPQSCLSFNFGRDSIHKMLTCELSNSERVLEPNRMQSKIGFDYLGVQKGVSLLIFVILIEIISKNELSSLPRLIYRIQTSRTNVGLTLKFGFGSLQKQRVQGGNKKPGKQQSRFSSFMEIFLPHGAQREQRGDQSLQILSKEATIEIHF